MGKSGWFSILVLIPFVGLWPLLTKGENKENKYGQSPKPELDKEGIIGF